MILLDICGLLSRNLTGKGDSRGWRALAGDGQDKQGERGDGGFGEGMIVEIGPVVFVRV